MKYFWIPASLICVVSWGVGNFIRRTIHDVPPYHIGLIYSLSLFSTNVLLFWYSNDTKITPTNTKTFASILAYSLLFVVANVFNMYAVKINPESSSQMHIISSCYPLIVAGLSRYYLNDPIDLIRYFIGAVLIIAGNAFVISSQHIKKN